MPPRLRPNWASWIPANQARYAANLAAFEGKVNALDKVIAVQMEAVDQKGYFVFHEAYGYWERHYGMSSRDTSP